MRQLEAARPGTQDQIFDHSHCLEIFMALSTATGYPLCIPGLWTCKLLERSQSHLFIVNLHTTAYSLESGNCHKAKEMGYVHRNSVWLFLNPVILCERIREV